MRSILFVCLGNICRSPLAEGYARHRIEALGLDWRVDSAGTGSWHVGEAPCERSIAIARKHGIDISAQRARQITPADAKRFDLILALDHSNLTDLHAMGILQAKILGAYGFEGADVPDPYYFKGSDGFEEVFKMIRTAVDTLIEAHR
jgi:protein-tyrosine phosphatase